MAKKILKKLPNRGSQGYRETAEELNITYTAVDEEESYGKGTLEFDVPPSLMYPGIAITESLFTGFLGYLGNIDSESEGFGQGGEFVNLLSLEFIPIHEGEIPPDIKVENVIYFNYAQLSGSIVNGRFQIPLNIPPDMHIRVSFLANLYYNADTGTSDGSEDVVLVLKKSTWFFRETEAFETWVFTDPGNESKMRDIFAGCTYGGTYSRFHRTTMTEIDNHNGPKYSMASPDDLGWDYAWLNEKHKELYDMEGLDENSNGFTSTAYPYVDQVYLNMMRYQNENGEWNFMRANRCGDTARVWLSVPFVDDNFAVRCNGVPHLNDSVFRVSEIRNGDISGIRMGQIPIMQREFSNPSKGRFGRIQSEVFGIDNESTSFTPDSDEHGIFGDMEDETYSYNYICVLADFQL